MVEIIGDNAFAGGAGNADDAHIFQDVAVISFE